MKFETQWTMIVKQQILLILLFVFTSGVVLKNPLSTTTEKPTGKYYDQRIFLYRFFHYFNNVTDRISEECRAAGKYFLKHQTEPWAAKSNFSF